MASDLREAVRWTLRDLRDDLIYKSVCALWRRYRAAQLRRAVKP